MVKATKDVRKKTKVVAKVVKRGKDGRFISAKRKKK